MRWSEPGLVAIPETRVRAKWYLKEHCGQDLYDEEVSSGTRDARRKKAR